MRRERKIYTISQKEGWRNPQPWIIKSRYASPSIKKLNIVNLGTKQQRSNPHLMFHDIQEHPSI